MLLEIYEEQSMMFRRPLPSYRSTEAVLDWMTQINRAAGLKYFARSQFRVSFAKLAQLTVTSAPLQCREIECIRPVGLLAVTDFNEFNGLIQTTNLGFRGSNPFGRAS